MITWVSHVPLLYIHMQYVVSLVAIIVSFDYDIGSRGEFASRSYKKVRF